MEDRRKQFSVAVVVLATPIIVGLLLAFSSDLAWSPFSSQYQIKLLVDQAPGVAPKTPVRLPVISRLISERISRSS